MKKPVRLILSAMTVLSLTLGAGWADEMPEMPQPGPEHAWLQQLVGEWEAEVQAFMPGQEEPVVSKGTETVRPLGGFWTISEVKSTMMDQPFEGNMTLGYDAQKQKYVGTWVDSMTGQLWKYEGTLDSDGKRLTLESEGSCPMRPGKVTRFKDVVELQDKDHRTFSSSMLDENGQWVTMMTGKAWRKE